MEFVPHALPAADLRHTEAYELIRTRDDASLPVRTFRAELRALYHALTAGRRGALFRDLSHPPLGDSAGAGAPAEPDEDRAVLLEQALGALSAEDRVVVELYVIEELPAADVARIVGLSNAKVVYNRAYRALASVRAWLEAQGVHRGDL